MTTPEIQQMNMNQVKGELELAEYKLKEYADRVTMLKRHKVSLIAVERGLSIGDTVECQGRRFEITAFTHRYHDFGVRGVVLKKDGTRSKHRANDIWPTNQIKKVEKVEK